VQANTQLAAVLGYGDVGVNSFHHQSLKRVAEPFVVTAEAPDGVIEAVEVPGRRFCVGVQWHPEEMAATRPDMMRLFEALVRAC
jgi:putative glutamine amidotransferase